MRHGKVMAKVRTMARIFLCHANEDKPRVRDVYKRLQEEGFQPWLAAEDLAPDQSWVQAIPPMLQASDLILLFISQHTLDDHGNFQGDLQRALDEWEGLLQGVNPTILVRVDACEIPAPLGRFQRIDFDQHNLAGLVDAIRALLNRHLP